MLRQDAPSANLTEAKGISHGKQYQVFDRNVSSPIEISGG